MDGRHGQSDIARPVVLETDTRYCRLIRASVLAVV